MSAAGIESWTFPVSAGVPEPVGPFAHATAAAGLLFVTGQMPVDPTTGLLRPGGITAQTDQVLANLAKVLALAGSSLERTVQVRAYLADFTMYDEFNDAYRRWFPDRLPSRTCIGVNGLALEALVEIDLVALMDNRPTDLRQDLVIER